MSAIRVRPELPEEGRVRRSARSERPAPPAPRWYVAAVRLRCRVAQQLTALGESSTTPRPRV